MDLGLFGLGMLGALITVYIAKEEPIPEFRPLIDTSDMEKEKAELSKNIDKTRKAIDDIQEQRKTVYDRLSEQSLSADHAQYQLTVLNQREASYNEEAKGNRDRLQNLEGKITRNQAFSRGLGFVVYILVGGILGALFAGRIQVEGLSGDLANNFDAMVIGAAWTGILSTIGFRFGKQKADEKLEASQRQVDEKFNAIKKEIPSIVAQEVVDMEPAALRDAAARNGGSGVQVARADAIARKVANKLDLYSQELQNDLNLTRRMIQKDLKGL